MIPMGMVNNAEQRSISFFRISYHSFPMETSSEMLHFLLRKFLRRITLIK